MRDGPPRALPRRPRGVGRGRSRRRGVCARAVGGAGRARARPGPLHPHLQRELRAVLGAHPGRHRGGAGRCGLPSGGHARVRAGAARRARGRVRHRAGAAGVERGRDGGAVALSGGGGGGAGLAGGPLSGLVPPGGHPARADRRPARAPAPPARRERPPHRLLHHQRSARRRGGSLPRLFRGGARPRAGRPQRGGRRRRGSHRGRRAPRRRLGLRDAASAFPPPRRTWTWPTPLGELEGRPDHVFVGPGWRAREVAVLESGGSDHRPLRVVLGRAP